MNETKLGKALLGEIAVDASNLEIGDITHPDLVRAVELEIELLVEAPSLLRPVLQQAEHYASRSESCIEDDVAV